MSGPRGALIGPFRPLLHSPELMDRIQQVGEHIRWGCDLPDEIREMAILMVARRWDQEFEWRYHLPIALNCGLTEADAEASAEEIADFHRTAAAVCAALGITPGEGAAGYRTISNAGDDGHQEVPHYHMHILAGRAMGPMLVH